MQQEKLRYRSVKFFEHSQKYLKKNIMNCFLIEKKITTNTLYVSFGIFENLARGSLNKYNILLKPSRCKKI